tara:strand:- start:136 stop:669 length:534 start_codon:yes stop_codon:yes gene_type:complete
MRSLFLIIFQVRSLAEYHAIQFLMNVLQYYKEMTLRVDRANDARLLGTLNSGTNSSASSSRAASGDEGEITKTKNNKNNKKKEKKEKKENRSSPLKRRQEKAKEKAIEDARKHQETKDVRRLGLFCRLTGLVGGLNAAMSSGATRFVLAGLFEACDFDTTISHESLTNELKNSLHGK